MANQYEIDPRQALFLKAYLDPKSETFSNAKQSAIAVGYSLEYAENIMSLYPDWLSEVIDSSQMVNKAEKKLNSLIDSQDERVAADVSKFVTGRLGKKKWSERQEVTGGDGEPLQIKIVKYGDSDTVSIQA